MGVKRIKKHLLVTCIVILFCSSSGLCGSLTVLLSRAYFRDEARFECESLGMDLVVIEDSIELSRVQQCIPGYPKPYWTGGFWSDGYFWVNYSPVSISAWASNEPSCFSFGCGIYLTEEGKLGSSQYYDEPYYAICESADENQDCTVIVPTTPSTTTSSTSTLTTTTTTTATTATPAAAATTTTTTATTTTTTATTTTTPATTTNGLQQTVPAFSNQEEILSVGAIIGLVAGVAAFVVIVIIGFCMWTKIVGEPGDDKIAPDPDAGHTVDLPMN